MAPRRARTAPADAAHRLPQQQQQQQQQQQLPPGLLLTDVQRRRWRLGPSIGRGGFGEIYCAGADDGQTVTADAQYVVKVEPHSNGPLFSEMHCYHRVGRADTIEAWRQQRRLVRVGMPRFLGSGSVLHDGERYRFMVMERLGSDLQRLLNCNGGTFPVATVLLIGQQVLDTLEYIHSKEYIHADIKAQNLLLGHKRGTENQVYLVDFGLACRYTTHGCHKPYKPDLRKAHDGTIEFTSRDAHIGAHSRRGDLEVLGYNLLLWTSGRLPWLQLLPDAEAVARQKNAFMQRVPALVRGCFPADAPLPSGVDAVQQYLEEVALLAFETTPDYQRLRELLRRGLRQLGSPAPSQLQFSASAAAQGRRRRLSPSGKRQQPPSKRRRRSSSDGAGHSSDSGQENGQVRARCRRGARGRAPLRLVTDNGCCPAEPDPAELEPPLLATSPALRSDGKLRDFDWQHYTRAVEEATRRKVNGTQRAAASDGSGDESSFTVYDNLTPAMREVLLRRVAKSAQKTAARPPAARKRCRRLGSMLLKCRNAVASPPMTQAMTEVLARRHKRLCGASQRSSAASTPGRTSRRSTPGRSSRRSTPGRSSRRSTPARLSPASGASGRTSARQTAAASLAEPSCGFHTPPSEVVKRRRCRQPPVSVPTPPPPVPTPPTPPPQQKLASGRRLRSAARPCA